MGVKPRGKKRAQRCWPAPTVCPSDLPVACSPPRGSLQSKVSSRHQPRAGAAVRSPVGLHSPGSPSVNRQAPSRSKETSIKHVKLSRWKSPEQEELCTLGKEHPLSSALWGDWGNCAKGHSAAHLCSRQAHATGTVPAQWSLRTSFNYQHVAESFHLRLPRTRLFQIKVRHSGL